MLSSSLLLNLLLGIALVSNANARGPWHATDRNTLGWHSLSPGERIEYQRHLRGLETVEQCNAYLAQHNKRIRERRRSATATPETAIESACDQLKARGKLK